MGQSWHANLTLLGGGALALLMIVIGLGALPAVAVISISVVLAVVGSRISFRRNAQGGGGHGTNVESTGRWKWLLLITALSLGAIVGMWLYAITLDHWGDTVTIMGFIALACLAVAVTAFSFLVADLTKGIARRANS